MSAPRLGVVTIVKGRHDHLANQLEGLRRNEVRADVQVVAAMGDPDVVAVVTAAEPLWRTEVVPVDVPASGELPLARARNAAAARAIELGAELLVFLDVDCVPAPALLGRYREAAGQVTTAEPWVLCGPVHYLPPADPGGYPLDGLAGLAGPHPARPAPPDGTLVPADDLRLFWSLSFATPATSWQRAGGFCEDYEGYGGEDTDFAMTLGAAAGRMYWVGGATAYHQHHEVESPPTRHAEAIVRNANLFYLRWGWFPMLGWLEAFTAMGVAHLDTGSGRWRTGPAGAPPGPPAGTVPTSGAAPDSRPTSPA